MSKIKELNQNEYSKFQRLTYESFRKMATDNSLSKFEKIGFPNSYREGYEEAIFNDMKTKLGNLCEKNKIVLDIGCGCSGLVSMIIENCELTGSLLLLVDSPEMLSNLPDKPFIKKYPGRFPDCPKLFEEYAGKIDAISVYSVMHSVFLEASMFDFIDNACRLLNDRGELFLGDIPNISKRKRFFSSQTGIKYHQAFTGRNELPKVEFNTLELEKIDDAVVFSILQRYRNSGFDTFVLEQDKKLPMANRREDILIKKP